MQHKRTRSAALLFFPSGRKVYTDSLRHNMARALCEPGKEWHKRTDALPREHAIPQEVVANWRKVKLEASAIEWLRVRGMVELHPQDAAYYRWSVLHERPRFKMERESHVLNGHRITDMSEAQKTLLTQTWMATARGYTHDVLARGAVELQRTLNRMELRGLVTIEKKDGVWKLSLSTHLRVPAPPNVPAGTV